MIESIHIASVATYESVPEKMTELSQFNYVFGSNATGKTTISKIIDNETIFPSCKVNWQRGTKLETLVYNEDFVKQNFEQSTELRGVFTLGKKRKDILQKIADAKEEHAKLTEEIEHLSQSLEGEDGLGGKKGELAELDKELRRKCWAQKQKHDEKLKGAFKGYRSNAEHFRKKVLQELNDNSASVFPIADLEKKAETVFGSEPTAEQIIPDLDAASLLNYEKNPVLEKRVIGNEDVGIAAMIRELNNSDWIKQGRPFYDTDTRICPFCQQRTAEEFAQSLNDYFDETFESDSNRINDLIRNYENNSDRLRQRIDSIITNPSKFLDVEKVKSEKQLLKSRLVVNGQYLAAKKKEPSQVVELESISDVVGAIKKLIDDANSHTTEHNKMVANLSQERSELKAQVWKYILENELKIDLENYKRKKEELYKGITSMTSQMKAAKEARAKKEKEIRGLEKQTVSVQPTIDEINAILSAVGFEGFSLEKAGNGISYKLTRSDGSDAKETLSEGERSFVTFLYFYHLLKGSQSESGTTTDRVVVFDDPVSSLDSKVLFIVSSLIRGLFDEVRAGTGNIKQIFILTHNVYFHKEITFNPKRTHRAMNEETFWVVTKSRRTSKLEKHDSNPIKSSYGLLWEEVRKPDRSSTTVQNALRRILENYFKILGGVNPDDIYAKFEGHERLICRSLFSWLHAGSHYALDDLYVSTDRTSVDNYLNVFKEIFEKTGQLNHYKMMMGDAYR